MLFRSHPGISHFPLFHGKILLFKVTLAATNIMHRLFIYNSINITEASILFVLHIEGCMHERSLNRDGIGLRSERRHVVGLGPLEPRRVWESAEFWSRTQEPIRVERA